MKKLISILCAVCFFNVSATAATPPEVNAKSMILMEQSTGEVLAENMADEKLPIASVTKIMTLLLIMESIDSGKIAIDDVVTVSDNAMSMGGSTMFLETGEELTVHELIKGIAVASANDGCVAMAEFITGSEEAFVSMMNEKAKELGMKNTQFKNTNGLDEEGHFSSARDVAIMSRELMKHEKIFEYTTIWTGRMNNDKYELSNTNKLVRFYSGATGLKTGSTSQAGCCISATANREGMGLIAVVLGAPSSNDRFNGARALLDFGFANYTVESAFGDDEAIGSVKVLKGVADRVELTSEDCSVLIEKSKKNNVEVIVEVPNEVLAPVKKGEKLGEVRFMLNGETLGVRDLVAEEDVAKKGFFQYFLGILGDFLRV